MIHIPTPQSPPASDKHYEKPPPSPVEPQTSRATLTAHDTSLVPTSSPRPAAVPNIYGCSCKNTDQHPPGPDLLHGAPYMVHPPATSGKKYEHVSCPAHSSNETVYPTGSSSATAQLRNNRLLIVLNNTTPTACTYTPTAPQALVPHDRTLTEPRQHQERETFPILLPPLNPLISSSDPWSSEFAYAFPFKVRQAALEDTLDELEDTLDELEPLLEIPKAMYS